MSKHTPGPWAVYSEALELNLTSFYGIDGAKGEPVVLWGKHGGIQVEANARLIAAAPDLLEALRTVLGYADLCDLPAAREAGDKARAAIAKATGEAA